MDKRRIDRRLARCDRLGHRRAKFTREAADLAQRIFHRSRRGVAEHGVVNEQVGALRELQRLGADISIDGHSALIHGVRQLHGAPVMATDLRASACLILAGLAAENTTEVSRIYHLDRGYEHLEEKLRSLGADVTRVS